MLAGMARPAGRRYAALLNQEIRMLTSQRGLFAIPRDICYLNSASYSPLPLRTQEAARSAVGRKGAPWTLDFAFAVREYERARNAAARLINAEAADIALISSVSYGVATVGKLLSIPPRTRVLVLENDHASPVLEWQTRAASQGFDVETVRQPLDGDWTSAILASIDRAGETPVSLASISSVHWSDGGVVDLERVHAALRRQGALFLIDATQGVGVLPMDVKALDPDFVVFPTYKWLLGPYGRAFLYIARRLQNGIPLEQAAHGRRDVRADAELYFADLTYVTGAKRFDMGERDHFISMEMASIGMEMMAEWGAAAVSERIGMLSRRIADALSGTKIRIMEAKFRAPHILSLGFPGGLPSGLIERLAGEGIHVASRLSRMRVSPHVFNDEEDADRFVEALKRSI
jgi:selenocysteine lyase/cysteine desulfurase